MRIAKRGCTVCGGVIELKPWHKYGGISKTCSKQCQYKLVSISMTGKKKSSEHIEKISGVNNHRFGKPAWNRKKVRFSKLVKYCYCGCGGVTIPKEYLRLKGSYPNYISGHNPDGMLGRKHTEETKKKWNRKQQWDNLGEERQNEITHKIRSQCAQEPNKTEFYLDSLIQDSTFKEFKYTGNGDVTIGGKASDWFNINGKKQVIEHFGNYFHGENKTGRTREQEVNFYKDHYKKYGYDCLVIWESELKEPTKVTEKIKTFTYGG